MNINSYLVMVLLAAIFTLSGCGTFNAIQNQNKRSEQLMLQERNFAGALQYLRAGREQDASDLFELVAAGPKVYGISDESLFRLALIQLRDSSVKSISRAEKLLGRLKKEYPKSIWRYQSEPLVVFLENSGDLRKSQKELKNLRETNLSLTKNNRELRLTIERLKELDIELEQKNRR